MSSPLEATVHSYVHTLNPGIIIFFLCGKTYTTFGLWHLLSPSLFSMIVIAFSVFISGFFSSITTSIIQSSILRQWTRLCTITWFSLFLFNFLQLLLELPLLLLTLCFEFSFSLLFFFFHFCSLSCFHFSFSSSPCFFFKAFSSRNFRESSLVITLSPETAWEDFAYPYPLTWQYPSLVCSSYHNQSSRWK